MHHISTAYKESLYKPGAPYEAARKRDQRKQSAGVEVEIADLDDDSREPVIVKNYPVGAEE